MNTSEKFINYRNGRFHQLIGNTLKIYSRQFLLLFFLSLILEFAFFGIFRLVVINIGLVYSIICDKMIFTVEIDFISEFGRACFFILLVVAFILFILRMSLITTTTWLTAENGRANIVVIFENTFKKIREILLFTILSFVILVFPAMLVIVGLLIQPKLFALSWAMIISAAFVPILFGSKILLFIAGMSKDNLHVGAAIQRSWTLTSKENYYKSTIVFLFFAILSIGLPWGLSSYLTQIISYAWVGIILAVGRALLYPMMDIAFTLFYLHLDFHAVERAAFSEEIKEQRKRSDELINQSAK